MFWVFTNRIGLNIINMMNGIAYPGVWGNTFVGKVNNTIIVHNNIFQNSTFFYGIINVWFLGFRQIDDLGITAPFKIKYGIFGGPAMFVIPNELSFRISRECGFTSSRKSKKYGGFTVFTHIGTAMHG